MPFHCGALKPEAERYIDRQFRTFAVRFRGKRLDYDDACELAAFLAIVPINQARWIFRWDKYGMRAAKSVIRWYSAPAEAEGMISANKEHADISDGIAIIQAMRAGGWTKGYLPKLTKAAIQQLYHSGMKPKAISKDLGLSIDQVHYVIWGRPDHSARRARAMAQLVL